MRAGRALARGDWQGAGQAAGKHVASIAMAGVAGQLGAGGAVKVAKYGTQLATPFVRADTIAGTKMVVNFVGNGAIGAGLGGSQQFIKNKALGDNGSVGAATAFGFVAGAGASLGGDVAKLASKIKPEVISATERVTGSVASALESKGNDEYNRKRY